MTVQELIDKLKECPADMIVECMTGEEDYGSWRVGYIFEPVSLVELYNNMGNTVRIT